MDLMTLLQEGDVALLRLPVHTRRTLAAVLADWLNIYAGMHPSTLRRQHFDLVVELRRLLLLPEESTSSAIKDGEVLQPDHHANHDGSREEPP